MKFMEPGHREIITGAIPLEGELGEVWEAFCKDELYAKKILVKGGGFYKKLFRDQTLDFIIFKGKEVIIGGQYLLHLAGKDIEKMKAVCQKSIENLFLQGITCVESAMSMMKDIK